MSILFIICALALCGGCQGSIYDNYRDVERLQPVQTLGIDAADDAVTVAVAAGEGQGEGTPAVLRHTAASVEEALAKIQNIFPEAQPYYAHVQYILFGSGAAEQGMERWLEWIERNPKMRLDAAAFIVRGDASELMLSAATEQGGTAEKLESLTSELRTLGEGTVVSVRALASALAESGTGLCGAIRCADEGDAIRFDSSASILPDGFAVFRDGAMCAFIEQDDVPAVLLLLGQAQGARITLDDDGETVTMRLGSGHTSIAFDDDGAAQIECMTEAVLVEAAGDADTDRLSAQLGAQLEERIGRVLALEAALGCDFLGLFGDGQPAAFSVTVRAEHSYGLRPQEGER